MLSSVQGCFHKHSRHIKDKSKELLKKVNLWHLKDQPFGTLSGGQAQKALIVKALITSPEILILDEPTANIDKKGEKIIFQMLKEEMEGKTILMVSHDLNIIISEVNSLIFVDKTVSSKLPAEVCEHFAVGLYHEPIIKE